MQRFASSSGPLAGDVVLGARIGSIGSARWQRPADRGQFLRSTRYLRAGRNRQARGRLPTRKSGEDRPATHRIGAARPGTDLAPHRAGGRRANRTTLCAWRSHGDSCQCVGYVDGQIAGGPDDLSSASPLFQEQDVTDSSLDADEPPVPKWPVRLDLPPFAQQERALRRPRSAPRRIWLWSGWNWPDLVGAMIYAGRWRHW